MRNKKSTIEEVPFDKSGLQVYPNERAEGFCWLPNDSFVSLLDIVYTERGQSAARFVLENAATGLKYRMFLTDMLDLARNATIMKGAVSARWGFVKRGANYGIKLVENVPDTRQTVVNQVQGRRNDGRDEPLGEEGVKKISRLYVSDVEDFLVENNHRSRYYGVKIAEMTPREFFSAYLDWNGLIGHDTRILDLLENLGWKHQK